MNILFVILLYSVWSSVFSLGKVALEVTTPLFLTGFRMLLAGLLIGGYLLIFKRSSLRLTGKQWLSLAILGFFSVYLTNILEFWGLQHLSAAKTCFIYGLSPFFAALFSYMHFREKMNLRKWIGLGIGFVGVMPVLLMQTGSEGLLHAFSLFSWPTIAMIGAVLASVYGWVLLRLAVKDDTVSPLSANSVSMCVGGALALIHSLVADTWAPVPVAAGQLPAFFQNALLIMLISNLLCYNLYGWLLKRYTATFLSFVGLLSPLFASLHGWILLGETPSWVILLSTAIVSLGLWIVYQAELKQGYIQKPAPVAD